MPENETKTCHIDIDLNLVVNTMILTRDQACLKYKVGTKFVIFWKRLVRIMFIICGSHDSSEYNRNTHKAVYAHR